MTYEQIVQAIYDENIELIEFDFKSDLKGLYSDNCIAISNKLNTTIEKKCVLSEELGHHYTTAGNILDLSDVRNRKQELHARLWAYNKHIGLLGIIQAFENRCKDLSEMAEYLNVTEDFLSDALKCYKSKYGISVKIDNYIIYFEPNLYVMKLFK